MPGITLKTYLEELCARLYPDASASARRSWVSAWSMVLAYCQVPAGPWPSLYSERHLATTSLSAAQAAALDRLTDLLHARLGGGTWARFDFYSDLAYLGAEAACTGKPAPTAATAVDYWQNCRPGCLPPHDEAVTAVRLANLQATVAAAAPLIAQIRAASAGRPDGAPR